MSVNLEATKSRALHTIYNLHFYRITVEEQFEKIQEAFLQSREAVTRAGVPNHILDAEETYYETNLLRNFRYSYVVLLFLVFEDQLESVCGSIQEKKELPIRARDLAGRNQLEKCGVFLKKIVGVPVDSSDLWAEMHNLSKIRDCIVHTNGRIEKSRDRVYLRRL